MGCGASAEIEVGEAQFNDPTAAALLEDGQRFKTNKVTGDDEAVKPGDVSRKEDDFFDFEVEEVEDGEQFGATKPWIGAIKEPTSHPEVNKDKPDQTYALDYVYGYRCQDSRQNVFYNPDGNICYMTAALGIILDKGANTQTFFGGGEVANESKQTANDDNGHTNDIMSMQVNTQGDRTLAVSGQVGKKAPAFVWCTKTGEKKWRVKLPKHCRQISACAIRCDGKYIATADMSDQHVVTIWTEKGEVWGKKTGGNQIFDIVFSHKKEGDQTPELWTAGVKHLMYWDYDNQVQKNGIYGAKGSRCSHACITYAGGMAWSGGSNGAVHVWQGNQLHEILKIHGKHFVGAIIAAGDCVYSGGKDGTVIETQVSDFSKKRSFEFGSLPRAIDVVGSCMVVGLRTGSIIELNMDTSEKKTLMQSHNDGEVWGLAKCDASSIITTGDDNNVMRWDVGKRCLASRGIVSNESRHAKRNRASTLGRLPESQQARAVACGGGFLAVCANDGRTSIRACSDINTTLKELCDSKEWCEVAEFSPCGAYLAVGSHDTNIYIYNSSDWSLKGKCTKHNASVTCVDWSQDSTKIRSVCNGYELLFFDIPSCDQDPNGASNTVDTVWASQHCKFGWNVDGLFPRGCDGSHINGVDMNEDQTLIAAGDDYGLVTLFRNPCRKGSKPRSFRGHSEHVVRVRFGTGDLSNYLFSVGGYDQTVMQWKQC